MSWLTKRLTDVRRAGERGGVAVLVAILLGAGVLIGMGAIVVDVGQLYVEREELQSGADAAAVAIAQQCARNPQSCGDAGYEVARRYADRNAADGASGISTLCGRTASQSLQSCPAGSDKLTDCIGEAPASGSYAEVRTTTRLPNGSTLLPPTFARALLGGQGYDGAAVGACARAAWGPPRVARGFGATISLCEWNQSTSDGTRFAPSPSQGTPSSTDERVLHLHTTRRDGPCPSGPSGGDSPGGFGWLNDPEQVCETTVDVGGTYQAQPGLGPSQACRTAVAASRAERLVLAIPIYDRVEGTGNSTTYRIAGFAAFVLTGYHLPGETQPSWLSGAAHCKGSDDCLYGYFTRALIAPGGEIGGPDLGATTVQLVG